MVAGWRAMMRDTSQKAGHKTDDIVRFWKFNDENIVYGAANHAFNGFSKMTKYPSLCGKQRLSYLRQQYHLWWGDDVCNPDFAIALDRFAHVVDKMW
jgi:hypothetical protein